MNAAEVAQLRNAVARELHAQLAMRGETIRLVDVPDVAYVVAIQLTREFRVECQPDDERTDDDSLGPDGAAFYASTMPADCGRYPIFDS
jgi:hypothetical protein